MEHSHPGLRAICTAMFFKIISKFPKGGFTLFTKTATDSAMRVNRTPYDEIVDSLRSDKLQALQYNTLRLLNLLVVKAPTESKRAAFLARLEALGVYDELYRIANDFKSEDKFVQLLQ
jgi:hypothetical protein